MNNDYKVLLRLFLDLCLLKKGPKDVPDSKALLKLVFLSYFLAGTVLISSDGFMVNAIMQALIETVLVAIFIYALVTLFSVSHRFDQAITAIYGTGTLITSLSIPFIFWVQDLSNNDEPTGPAGLVVFLIVCWSFVVMAHIIRETIQKPLSVCLLLTFCYLYLSYQVINWLYPIEAL
ncbi:MAG: hypothetical protein A6F70_00970 [Cycloclasticus sp. symbiont of Bathymodiolus heckerae]|nr:MAG: hypothetical protein A6F70_00970 [Cycloclasticus sp. symbiont of Bathymodiolus heckerae]